MSNIFPVYEERAHGRSFGRSGICEYGEDESDGIIVVYSCPLTASVIVCYEVRVLTAGGELAIRKREKVMCSNCAVRFFKRVIDPLSCFVSVCVRGVVSNS